MDSHRRTKNGGSLETLGSRDQTRGSSGGGTLGGTRWPQADSVVEFRGMEGVAGVLSAMVEFKILGWLQISINGQSADPHGQSRAAMTVARFGAGC